MASHSRSNRTDNEELFHIMRFTSGEDRRYQLKLWDPFYNHQRPHQGIGGQTPLQVYQSGYPLHVATRMLI